MKSSSPWLLVVLLAALAPAADATEITAARAVDRRDRGLDVQPLTVIHAQPEGLTRRLQAALHLQNTGTGFEGWQAEICYDPRQAWDILWSLDLEAVTGNPRHQGVEFDGRRFWVCARGDASGGPQLYAIDRQGRLVGQLAQGPVTGWGFRDLAWDGRYLYGGDESGFFQIDPVEGTSQRLFSGTLGLAVLRALAYYPPRDSFLACDWGVLGDGIVEFDRSGRILRRFGSEWDLPAARYGLAYDRHAAGGPFLYISGQAGDSGTMIHQAVIETPGSEEYTGLSRPLPPVEPDAPEGVAGGLLATGAYQERTAVLGGVVQAADADVLYVLDLGGVQGWLDLEPRAGVLAPDSGVDLDLAFDSRELAPGEYEAEVVIQPHGSSPQTVSVTLRVMAPAPTPEATGAPPDALPAPTERTRAQGPMASGRRLP